MARKKYFTLSTGYKVEQDQEDTSSHLAAAIVGESCVEIRMVQSRPTLDSFADAVMRRVYQECEYLSRRYNLCLWRLIGASTEVLLDIITELQEKADEPDCDSCEHQEECRVAAQSRCDPSKMN